MNEGPRDHEHVERQEGEGPLHKQMDRRQFLKAAGLTGAAIGAGTLFGGVASAEAKRRPRRAAVPDVSGDCLAVLGLGAGPVYYRDRNNTGFALFHNGGVYLVDAGAGTVNEFMKLGVTLDKVKGLFFTHYHIDHTAGYADLLTRGSQANGPVHNLKNLNVYGPDGPRALVKNTAAPYPPFVPSSTNALDALTAGIQAGFAPGYDLHFWAKPYVGAPPFLPGPRPTVITKTITANSPTSLAAIPLLSDDDVQVEAIEVDHDEAFGTCYAYRFTLLNAGASTGKVIVFSGDRANYNARRDFSSESPYYAQGGPGYGASTGFFPAQPTNAEFQAAFNDFAKGATVLVHEAAKNESATLVAAPDSSDPFMKALYWHLVDSHTDVNEVPKIAKDAGVDKLVLCHYGDYTQKSLETARGIILSAVEKANAKVRYRGRIIAPLEGDVIRF